MATWNLDRGGASSRKLQQRKPIGGVRADFWHECARFWLKNPY